MYWNCRLEPVHTELVARCTEKAAADTAAAWDQDYDRAAADRVADRAAVLDRDSDKAAADRAAADKAAVWDLEWFDNR